MSAAFTLRFPTFRFHSRFPSLLAGCLLALGLQGASAAEVAGIKFEETAKVAGRDLVLNGAGLRTRFMIKIYAIGLYLPEKKRTAAEVQKLEGPRRLHIVLRRDLEASTLSEAFMTGLNKNVDAAEKSRLASQTAKFAQLFTTFPAVKEGDVLTLDWIPASGTQVELNGRKLGETIPDVAFYNAVLRIWIGDKPADDTLKAQLLGTEK
jgi:hypothetical protein